MSFPGPIRCLLWALAILMTCSLVEKAHAAAPSVDAALKAMFGDWSLRCESTALNAGEQCVLVQSVASEDRPAFQMAVIVLRNPDGKFVLRVVVPLGIILPSGLGLKIDRVDIGRTGFVRCFAIGCMAEVMMDDGLIQSFSSGETALFVVFSSPDEGVGVPIRLSGFASGLLKVQ